MCGRFSLGVETDRLVAEFGIDVVTTDHSPRFNIAPTQPVLAVVRAEDGLRLGSLRWGLIPPWADDSHRQSPLINARGESAHHKPAFRDAFLRRRCWILADGFFEWTTHEEGGRQPIHFRLPQARPFAFAGLWQRTGAGEDATHSCTILTTTASETVRPVHHRMPVILPPDLRDQWLDPTSPADTLQRLLQPYPHPMEARRVSPRVNAPHNDDAACVEPVS